MPSECRGSLEGARNFVRDIAPVARRLGAEGFRFVYHNHHFEFEKFDGVSAMDVLLAETDPRDFGFLMDTYWVQYAGHDPLKWIRKFAGRMDVIHLKDVMVHKGETVYGEVGSGNLDWDAIVAACRETGVTWYAVEQDDCPGDPFDSLAKSRRYLQKFL
jgi:sugar phosphate isomerase/epimerase